MRRFTRRLFIGAIALVVVVGAVLATAGVLHIRNTKDEAAITINKTELNVKTQEAIEKTKEAGEKVLDKTGDALQNAAQGLRDSSHKEHGPVVKPEPSDPKSKPPGSNTSPSDELK